MGADAAALQERNLPPGLAPVMRLRPLALAAALLLLPCSAPAQEAPPHVDEARRPAPPRPAQTQKSAPARPAPPKPWHKSGPAVKNDGKRYLRSLDENHDGRITRNEFLARAREKFAELDLNHDGVLSPEEREKARDQARKKRDEARRRAGKPPISVESDQARPLPLADRDRNADGRVTLGEYLSKRERQFDELDKNHDGVISREEAKAAKGRILARRAEIKAEKRAVAQRQVERQALRDEKIRARKRRAARHEEIANEREARVQRRMERMARRAGQDWGLSSEAAALAPEPAPAAAP